MKYTKRLLELSKNDADIAGGKGASLGELIHAGIPVPNGFVITANAFDKISVELNAKIKEIFNKVDTNNASTIDKASEELQKLILNTEIPKSITDEIINEFKILNSEFVAIRSSATTEDSVDHAWAGQLDSFLNTTEADLLQNVKKCWASIFTPRAIFYRFEKGLESEHISVAVVVQQMVESEMSGIAFSVHPVTQDTDKIIIEAGFGLGEALVSGAITPDAYIVSKSSGKIIEIMVNNQDKALYYKDGGGNNWVDLGKTGTAQVLTAPQILELAELIKKIENHYGTPQDIEWAYANGEFYITQSRAITTLKDAGSVRDHKIKPSDYTLFFPIEETSPFFMESILSGGYLDHQEILTYTNNQGGALFYLKSESNTYADIGYDLFMHKDTVGEYFKKCEKVQKDVTKYISTYTIKNSTLENLLKEYRSQEKAFYNVYKYTEYVYTKSIESFLENILKEDLGKKYKKGMLFEILSGSVIVNNKKIQTTIKTLNKLAHIKLDMRSSMGNLIDIGVKILEKISKKTDISVEEIEHLYIDEIIQVLEGTLEKDSFEKKIKDRKAGVIMMCTNNKCDDRIGKKAIPLINKLNNRDKSDRKITELTGQVVNTGCVVGRAILVPYVVGDDSKEFKKIIEIFKKNDIIVARNTTPELMPILAKASAVITTEGGILCHAAIVSRELSIPGIVGIQGLFKNIKTGDRIEVDANNGIIRIL